MVYLFGVMTYMHQHIFGDAVVIFFKIQTKIHCNLVCVDNDSRKMPLASKK